MGVSGLEGETPGRVPGLTSRVAGAEMGHVREIRGQRGCLRALEQGTFPQGFSTEC